MKNKKNLKNRFKFNFKNVLIILAFLLLNGVGLFVLKYPYSIYNSYTNGQFVPFGPITAFNPYRECIEMGGRTIDSMEFLLATYQSKNTNTNYLQIFDNNFDQKNLVLRRLMWN